MTRGVVLVVVVVLVVQAAIIERTKKPQTTVADICLPETDPRVQEFLAAKTAKTYKFDDRTSGSSWLYLSKQF